MAPAKDETVLGNFQEARFHKLGFQWRFFRKGKEFWVETQGLGEATASYRIDYTLGWAPLQQYLVAFPDGRLQVLGVAWDTEASRWFWPQDASIPSGPGERGHWTSPQYTWNFMCAECHTTNLHKGYDAKADRYDTTFAEGDVGCEACHGPASEHLSWAKSTRPPGDRGFSLDLGGRGPWTAANPPRPDRATGGQVQLETCARCHSRRAVLAEPYQHGQPLAQTHALEVLEEGLYHPDGQIDDEVFEYGSFLQSKMFRAGVVCTDCHDPHTARLRREGESLCLSCHLPATYSGQSHSHHAQVSCVDCHMAGKVFMGTDFRRDHSLRIPRPDLTVKLGVPNACTQCHKDRSAQWAADAWGRWWGQAPPHHGEILAAARVGDPRIGERLKGLVEDPAQSDIVRATAVGYAALYPELLREGLSDASDLVRRQAVRAASGLLDPEQARAVLTPLASDPVRAVRVEVGKALAGLPDLEESSGNAVKEYEASLIVDQDRAEALLGLADLAAARGESQKAEALFRRALQQNRASAQVYVNLSDFLRSRARDPEGEAILRQGLRRLSAPESAPIHHALGLLLHRTGRPPLEELRKAAAEQPDNPEFGLAYALALDSAGKPKQALAEHERVLAVRPFHRDSLEAAAELCQRLGRARQAREFRQRLQLEPANSFYPSR